MRRFSRWCSAALVFALLILSYVPAAAAKSDERLKVEPAHEWTELFNRLSGWVGADGFYTIPLNGVDSIGSADSQSKTFMGFHDSIFGEADPNTLKWKGNLKWANNTAAILTGSEPDPKKIEFIYGKNGSMSYSGSASDNSIYGYRVWPHDGIVIDNYLRLRT